ncbi:hypothetical protein Pst134EA_007550 [Puccinia striiformis f. sp. tritici]|uniref:hypothetical protein n=1 Tax=Puccinia striiformis f. sp. tritici TaxID=168172 RepID=UPI0020083411|nr:hypothetical protein Pst134EA_007550 [Puccinia striiformis f. sp. tritici]KAH9470285.1 hypothetical protein Pst134EA_007550 [Puccinia striiformis f. sp. tritici]
MKTIVDLPLEVLEVIIDELAQKDRSQWNSSTPDISGEVQSGRKMVQNLRLVCRKWADWIYVHHLYREMIFGDITRTCHFIRHIANRPSHLPRAKIKNLRLICIWTRGPRPPLYHHETENDPALYGIWRSRQWINSHLVASLVELFSDTIFELELSFWNILSFPERTLKAIGSIENLHTLKIGHERRLEHCDRPIRRTPRSFPFDEEDEDDDDDDGFEEELAEHHKHLDIDQEFESDATSDDDDFTFHHRHHYPDSDNDNPADFHTSPRDMGQVKSKLDYEGLISLIVTTQKLVSLDLSNMRPIHLRKPIESGLYHNQIPAITHLEVNMRGQTLSRLIHLSLLLKPTLKVLSFSYAGEPPSENLVPVFKNLSPTLEGLFITDTEHLLGEITQLEFPKLRVFRTLIWEDSLIDLFKTPMFTSAPLQILGIFWGFRLSPKFTGNPFCTLASLKKLVTCKDSPDHSLAQIYLDACDANGIQVVYREKYQNKDIPTIMVSPPVSSAFFAVLTSMVVLSNQRSSERPLFSHFFQD